MVGAPERAHRSGVAEHCAPPVFALPAFTETQVVLMRLKGADGLVHRILHSIAREYAPVEMRGGLASRKPVQRRHMRRRQRQGKRAERN